MFLVSPPTTTEVSFCANERALVCFHAHGQWHSSSPCCPMVLLALLPMGWSLGVWTWWIWHVWTCPWQILSQHLSWNVLEGIFDPWCCNCMEQQPGLGTCDVVWHCLWLQALASLKYHARLNQTYNMVNNYVNRSGATATRSFSCTGWIDEYYAKNPKFCVFGIWNEIKGRAQIFGWPARVFQWVSSSWASMTRSQGRMGCIAEILCFGSHCILLYCSRSRLEAQKSARLLGNVHKPGIDQKKESLHIWNWFRCLTDLSSLVSNQVRSFAESSAIFASHGAICISAFGAIGLLLDLSVLHHMSPYVTMVC